MFFWCVFFIFHRDLDFHLIYFPFVSRNFLFVHSFKFSVFMSIFKDYFNFCVAGKTGHFMLGSYLTKHRNLGYGFLFLFEQAATLPGVASFLKSLCGGFSAIEDLLSFWLLVRLPSYCWFLPVFLYHAFLYFLCFGYVKM